MEDTFIELPEEDYKKYASMPDDSETVKVGDRCVGYWWMSGLFEFTAQKIDYNHDILDEKGIGFRDDAGVYDIGLAYHIIKL